MQLTELQCITPFSFSICQIREAKQFDEKGMWSVYVCAHVHAHKHIRTVEAACYDHSQTGSFRQQ